MRYFLYRDTQILGPLGPEEMGEGELSLDILVCEEGLSGVRDSDWKSLGEVPELARLCPRGAAAKEVPSLELEALGIAQPGEADLTSRLLEGLYSRLSREEIRAPAGEESPELSASRERIRGLSDRLEVLQARLEELEKERGELLRRLEVMPPAPSPPESALPPEGPGSPSQGPGEVLKEPQESPKAAKKEVRFLGTKSFPLAKRELPPPPLPETELPPGPWEALASEQPLASEAPQEFSGSLGEAGGLPGVPEAPAAALPPEPEEPAPAFLEPQAAAPLTPPAPPETLTMASPAPGEEGVEEAPMAAAPSPVTPPPPLTAQSAFPAGILPAPAPTPQGPGAEAASSQELIARLAKPPTTSGKAAAPRRRPSSMFVAGGAVLLLGLVAAGFFFFRNPKEMKLMLNMGEAKPLESPEEAAPQTPAAPPAQEAPAPAASREPVPDAGEAAISLVKNHPLAGERGNVGQWLQYSFMADPGEGNREEWTAGAVDATTYLVHYQLLPGSKSALREPIAYLFEADTSRRTVKGASPAARDLLAGGPPVERARPAKKAVYRRKAVRRKVPARSRQVPLLPLPSDSELLAPAPEGFRGETIR